MDLLYTRMVVFSMLCTFTITASFGQQPVPLSQQAVSVKEKAASLKAGDKISVVRMGAPEEYGKFKSAGSDDLTFYDVDEKHDATLSYAEVKKIKEGYGGYNGFTGRHTDRTKGWIAGGIVAGVLIGLVVAAASAKN